MQADAEGAVPAGPVVAPGAADVVGLQVRYQTLLGQDTGAHAALHGLGFGDFWKSR